MGLRDLGPAFREPSQAHLGESAQVLASPIQGGKCFHYQEEAVPRDHSVGPKVSSFLYAFPDHVDEKSWCPLEVRWGA